MTDDAPPLVVVHWEDAANVPEWHDIAEAAAFDRFEFDVHCTNVGYLIRDDDECVVVAARASGDFGAVGLFERIPRRMVERIDYLEPRRPIGDANRPGDTDA